MSNNYKPFDREAYKKAVPKSRRIVKSLLEDMGYKVETRKRKFDPDFILTDTAGNTSKFDVSVKVSWTTIYPYGDNIRFPARVLKWTTSGPMTFGICNADCSQMFVFGGTTVASSPIINVETRFSQQPEPFVNVPIKAAIKYERVKVGKKKQWIQKEK